MFPKHPSTVTFTALQTPFHLGWVFPLQRGDCVFIAVADGAVLIQCTCSSLDESLEPHRALLLWRWLKGLHFVPFFQLSCDFIWKATRPVYTLVRKHTQQSGAHDSSGDAESTAPRQNELYFTTVFATWIQSNERMTGCRKNNTTAINRKHTFLPMNIQHISKSLIQDERLLRTDSLNESVKKIHKLTESVLF